MVESRDSISGDVIARMEQDLRRQIDYYEAKAANYEAATSRSTYGLVTVYRYSADRKREMLKALKEHGLAEASQFPY